MNLNKIKQTNDFLYDSILSEIKQDGIIPKDQLLLETIINIANSPISKCFINPFLKIQKFLSSIDLNHNGLSFFFNQVFSPNFSRKCNEINSLLAVCDGQGYSIKKDLLLLSKVIVEEIDQDFLNFVGNPEETKVYTRFLPDKSRWLSRTSKKTQSINIRQINNNASDVFNIENYYHNSDSIKTIKNDLQNKKDVMYKMGCTNISKEIDFTIKSLEESLCLQRYGFHRVTISKLAKCLSNCVDGETINVKPVTFPQALAGTNAFRFLEICESFPHQDNWAGPIFDHYAELNWKSGEFSILIGEIDTRSYFISYNFED